jgi:hypothetical protein
VAQHRHKREPNARPLSSARARLALLRRPGKVTQIAGIAAAAVTVPAIALGVATATPIGHPFSHPSASADLGAASAKLDLPKRPPVAVSRSESRVADARGERTLTHGQGVAEATARAVRQARTKKWTTTLLNLWTAPNATATQVGAIDAAKRVLVTGRTSDGRDEIVVGGLSRWVTSGYLDAKKPATESTVTAVSGAAAGLSMAPCPDPSVENGLTSGAVYVYRSVCHAFPQITTYGGWDAHGEHSSGKALDIMTSDKALGDTIAAYLQSHASELGLYDVIWWDRIWTPVRASEGWRYYGDHGSPTANHMDHVHVSTNG